MYAGCTVALRKESVDRNSSGAKADSVSQVALRKESVDRNFGVAIVVTSCVVALRKESVDRNAGGLLGCDSLLRRSPQGERG